MNFESKPIIGCIHLRPTPGAHLYDGDIQRLYRQALGEAEILVDNGVQALIVENFRDGPFFPDRVPVETVATIAGVTRSVVERFTVPVGVAVLRNDSEAAVAIAAATGASFVRVNVHVGATLTAQGVLEGKSYKTLRLRSALKADVKILADAGVKHSRAWSYPELAEEVRDAAASADAIVVSGSLTGVETEPEHALVAKRAARKPVLIGSGATPDNLHKVFAQADGFIVGTYFKVDGVPANEIDPGRVREFVEEARRLRAVVV